MKKIKIILVVCAVIVVLWSAMFITDITRSNDFKEPVFAKEIKVLTEDNSILYQGLGYVVYTQYFTNQYGETYPGCSEVWLFGMLVSAVIV